MRPEACGACAAGGFRIGKQKAAAQHVTGVLRAQRQACTSLRLILLPVIALLLLLCCMQCAECLRHKAPCNKPLDGTAGLWGFTCSFVHTTTWSCPDGSTPWYVVV